MADQDFLKANPADQHAYMMAVDQDYAAASPGDQQAYLAHVTGKPVGDFAANAVPRPDPIAQDQAKATQASRAAGPNIQPGAAEAASGFGAPIEQSLKSAARPVATGASFAAPIMTGGASLPVQMGVFGATGAAQAAAEGESPRHIIGSAALSAAIPPITEAASPLFASMRNAKEGFNTVAKATRGIPLKVTPELSRAAEELLKESEAGGGPAPQVVRKFIQRMTDPTKGAMEYDEARRFASNASRMSGKELMGQNPNQNMKRLLGEFHGRLNEAVANQAAEAGVQPMHEAAMTEYGQAASRNRAGRNLLKYGKKAAPYAAGLGGLYELSKAVTKK